MLLSFAKSTCKKSTYSSPNRLLKASRSPSKPVLILCRFLYWLLCQLDCQLCRLLYQLHCHPFSRLLGCRRHPKWRSQGLWGIQIPATEAGKFQNVRECLKSSMREPENIPKHVTTPSKINKSNQPRDNGQRKKVFDTWSISHDEASQSWNPNRCSCCWRCLPPTGRHLKRQQGPVELICAIQTIHPSKHQSVSARVFLWVQHMQTTVSPSTWHAPNAISKPWRKCACPSNSFTSTSHQALCATHNKGMPCFQKISTWKLRNHRDQVTSRQF